MFQKKMAADPDAASESSEMAHARPGVAPAAMLGGGKKKFGGGKAFGKGGAHGGFSKGGGVKNFRGGKR